MQCTKRDTGNIEKYKYMKLQPALQNVVCAFIMKATYYTSGHILVDCVTDAVLCFHRE